MLDHVYDLSPCEDLRDIDGHLLVFVLDDDDVSAEFGRLLLSKTRALDDRSEFSVAIVRAEDFPAYRGPAYMPCVTHFLSGTQKGSAFGLDECMDFFEEFVENNRHHRRR